MANEVDHFGSGWTDQATGITYNASGEAINAPDTGGSSHFDPSGQLILAGGENVDMSAYAPITSPENYPGGFWGYYQHLVDTGQVNNDTQGLGGVAGYLRSHGYMVPLALASGGLAIEAAGGLGATSAGIGAGTEGAAGLGGVAGTEGAAGIGAMGPTYAEMGYTPGAFTDANLGYTGAAQELGLSGSSTGLTDLSGAQGSAMLESMGLNTSGMSAADILKYATQAKQALGVGTTLAKLLGGTGTTSGTTSGTSKINSNALANLLRPAAQTNDYVGQIKANQNPFTFTSAGQTVASPGMYDVSGSNLATALRKA